MTAFSSSFHHSLRAGLGTLLTGLTVHAGAVDLLDVYRHAQTDDRRVAAAQAQWAIAVGKRSETRAASLPQVVLRATSSWNVESYSPPQMNRSYNGNGYAVVLTQPLYRVQNAIGDSQAELAIRGSELQLQSACQDLILRVAVAYFDVLLARELLRSGIFQQQAAAAHARKVEVLLAEGASTQPDLDEALSQDDLVNAQVVVARSRLALRLEALRQLAGPQGGELLSLRNGVEFHAPTPDDIDAWADAAARANLDVQAAENSVRIAEKEVDKQRAASSPTLDLVAGTGRFSQNGGVIFGLPIPSNTVRQTSVGLQLTIPLFTGGGIDSRTAQATASKDEALDLLEEGRRHASLQARSLYLSLVNGVDRIRATAQSLVSSRSALRSIRASFDIGQRLGSDVLHAEQRVAVAEQQLAEARVDHVIGQLRLKAVTGTLDAGELARVNDLLEPAPREVR